MEIKKIKTIKKYKSFRDYSWHSFLNAENLHSKTNIFYGENGSGKSSVCNILKSISGEKDITKYHPEKVELVIGTKTHTYENRAWDSPIAKGSVLFFDREFVEKNVHLGRDRGTQQGEQEQQSGNLIIEFDAEAIKLRSLRDKLGKIRDEKDGKVSEYQRDNNKALSFELTDDEEFLYKKYKSKNGDALDRSKQSLNEKRDSLENSLRGDKQLLQKVTDVQAINDIEIDLEEGRLSPQSSYQNVFNFDLKEQVKIEAQAELVQKIRDHKEFFEKGFDIRKSHPQRCPFCQSENQEDEIKKVLNIYDQLYDDSYKKQRLIFDKNKQQLINEISDLQELSKNINVSDVFIALKRLADRYSIKGLYSVEEEANFQQKIATKNIDDLKERISNLVKPTKEDISISYKEAQSELKILNTFIKKIKALIIKKNCLIQKFKNDNTDSKLASRMEKAQSQLAVIKVEIDFIQSSKIEKQKLKLEKDKGLIKLQWILDKAKGGHKEVREQYEKYCSSEAFAKTLKKIESYFDRFNFSFKLQLDTGNRHTSTTKELPFAFKVVDLDGGERDLKEGLSEGEVQVLSLCFFFAFLDIQDRKSEKILVFDDPITSLDDSNLSSLVDLVSEEKGKFSQTLIFSHHRTFFKFLRKKFNDKCREYNILRNKNQFGGSFICKSQEERFLQRLTDFENHLTQIGQNPSGFDAELKIIEYGQYLRYETEHFIKCRLLHWNEANEFAKVVEGVKANKKIIDDDLDKIKQIYSFCNWTTSHVDVGDDHGMSQLKEKINDFVTISDKY